LDGVTSVLLSGKLGEGGGHGVVSFADVISIGQIRAVPEPPVTALQLAHPGTDRRQSGQYHRHPVGPGCNDQAKLLQSFVQGRRVKTAESSNNNKQRRSHTNQTKEGDSIARKKIGVRCHLA
jgi:hypothetical protein